MNSDTERAWAAGFFDGEGNVSQKGRVQISSTERDLLVRFDAAVGGLGHIYGPYQQAGNRQPHFSYRAGRRVLPSLAAAIGEFLSSTKAAQLARGLSL